MNTRQTYTYKQIDQMTLDLYEKIKCDFKPDVIVGVSRGGLLPAVILSHKFSQLVPKLSQKREIT